MDDYTITGTFHENGNDHPNGMINPDGILEPDGTIIDIASDRSPSPHGSTGTSGPIALAVIAPAESPIPAFDRGYLPNDLRAEMTKAVDAWLLRTPSPHTRDAYQRDLDQFLAHAGIAAGAFEKLAADRPEDVSRWRERSPRAARPTARSAAR